MPSVREFMTPDPVCIGTEETLQKAAETMRSNGVGALPICGKDGKLKGMLTDRDIVVRGVGDGKPLDTVTGQLTQAEAVTIGADDPVEDLLSTMVQHGVKRLPVIDGERLVGIVAMADAARALPNPTAGELVDALGVE
ncbi:CBS domain-containing protein [Lipingzhangella halophila]|uniref:CBS domain-containing protein n=1 Tax=Lipingzhangella halophila TaxID=1783352 RepID=A0A7W7RE06_9ACTN|nr:CBS domain-containing protein [Lipingzhangella halophila]MBB4930080.1 CBS domain-containing protein [Lipingzhangella halophila]